MATFLSSVSFILDPVLLEPDFILFVCRRTCRVYRETGVDTHLLHQDLRFRLQLVLQVIKKKGFKAFVPSFARHN